VTRRRHGLLHWVPAWGDARPVTGERLGLHTACGRRVKAVRSLVGAEQQLRCGTSDRDFACDRAGRCARCWHAWKAL
jgi:hypothetical protein